MSSNSIEGPKTVMDDLEEVVIDKKVTVLQLLHAYQMQLLSKK